MEKPAQTTVPIDPLLARRWSPRAFASRRVEDEQLDALLEAARWAPSCFNAQPWRFAVARADDDPAAHARLAALLFPKNLRWAAHAPLLIVTAARRVFDDGKPNQHAWHDVGLAVGNLLAQATSMGLVVHQLAGFDREQARIELGLPDDCDPVTMLAIGFPGEPSQLDDDLRERELAPRTRIALTDLILDAPRD
jgi:nitroreductase